VPPSERRRSRGLDGSRSWPPSVTRRSVMRGMGGLGAHASRATRPRGRCPIGAGDRRRRRLAARLVGGDPGLIALDARSVKRSGRGRVLPPKLRCSLARSSHHLLPDRRMVRSTDWWSATDIDGG
jgi:hypothetical protein